MESVGLNFTVFPSSAPTDSSMTVNESWISIYTTLILSVLQISVLLAIFECSRRSKDVGDVYDRRRLVWPGRVPPPLMQKRGLLGGYLGFEWYRVRCADKQYLSQAQKEFQERIEVDARMRKSVKRAAQLMTGANYTTEGIHRRRTKADAVDQFLIEAEQQCREEAPFYTPDDSDTLNCGVEVNLNNNDSENADDSGIVNDPSEGGDFCRDEDMLLTVEGRNHTTKQLLDIEISGAPSLPFDLPNSELGNASTKFTETTNNTLVTNPSSTAMDDSATHDTFPATNSKYVAMRHSGIQPALDLRTHLCESSRGSSGTISKGQSSILKATSSERGSSEMKSPSRRVRFFGKPLPDGSGTATVPSKGQRKLLFHDESSTVLSRSRSTAGKPTTISLGSEKAKEEAKMRYYTQDHVDWDVTLLQTVYRLTSVFVKKRILKVNDTDNTNADDTKNKNSSVKEVRKRTKMSQNIVRRPLSPEKAELLRCIGLDSFVMLQFLNFGFAISFWPLLLACVLLVPTYYQGSGGEVGFFKTTVSNLGENNEHLWVVVVFGYVQILYILRRLWVEWETFLPLRNDFLDHGDFSHSKHQDQYRRTCIVEYVPRSHRHDNTLYEFFDTLFPGQIQRAEVLLNAEYIRKLIVERLSHIKAYEDVYALKVHRRAQYLRELDKCRNGNVVRRRCRKIVMPRKPSEPKIIVKEFKKGNEFKNTFISQSKLVVDPRTYNALPYHFGEISRLNKDIEDEFVRLAQAKRRTVQKSKKGIISRALGFDVLFSRDDGRVHSSTAFVEFNSLTAKQQAIQCNLTGVNGLLTIHPVPEVRDMIWDNAHVPRHLIHLRTVYANIALTGCLIVWSILVAAIRALEDVSGMLSAFELVQKPLVATILDAYLPVMIVECLVRYIAFGLRYVAEWIRFKTISEIDTYVLVWYFGFRLLTFIFVIVGGSLVETGESLVDDPVGYIKDMSKHASIQSEFFMSYILVAGAFQVFFRFSQVHNVFMFWFTKKITTEEAVSQRTLDAMRCTIKKFHQDEFIPLFLFIFMISGLYGWIAPLANIYVAIFFKCSYKVFKYMALYVYGNDYESGGLVFYTLTDMLISLLYCLVVLLAGYCSMFGSAATAGAASLLLFVIAGVHRGIMKTFKEPSETLPLTKALEYDSTRNSAKKRAMKMYRRAKAIIDSHEKKGNEDLNEETEGLTQKVDDAVLKLLRNDDSEDSVSAGTPSNSGETEASSREIRDAIAKLERKYRDDGSMSELTGDTENGQSRDFFIYRQPSLNRATWETAPRPYWEASSKDYSQVEFWR